jgi:hypothetical protein
MRPLPRRRARRWRRLSQRSTGTSHRVPLVTIRTRRSRSVRGRASPFDVIPAATGPFNPGIVETLLAEPRAALGVFDLCIIPKPGLDRV